MLVSEDPVLPAIICAHTTYRGNAHPHSRSVGGIGDDAMQAKPSRAGLPATAGGMIRQASVQAPVYTAISTYPEARRIDSRVDRSRLTWAPRLNHPDILELLTAFLRELNSLLGFLPRLPKVVAIAQKGAEETTVLGPLRRAGITLVSFPREPALCP